MRLTKLKSEKGFTIVELMIALSVLSVVLITSTLALIQIGSLYSKGVNAADLQNVNRNVVSDITGQLQFSGKVPVGCTQVAQLNADGSPDTGAPARPGDNITCYADSRTVTAPVVGGGTTNATIYSYCIGSTRYSYVLDQELGNDTVNGAKIPHVLWRDTLKDTSACKPVDILDGTDIDQPPSNGDGYEMLGSHMRLTRFDIEPLAGSNGVYTVQVWMAFGDSDLVQTQANGASTCLTGKGTQFCAISTISTQVTGRVY